MTNNPPIKKLINVLLVDDHQMILDGLTALINSESEMMRVVGRTSDPRQVLPMTLELDPDVLMLDLDLGKDEDGRKICGIDLLPDLAKESKTKVLILTGELDVAVQAEAVNRGARGVILKNAPGEVIIRAVKKIAGGQRWHSDEILDYITTHRERDKSCEDSRKSDSANIETLTPMQLRVITAVAGNVTSSNKQIAKMMRISEHTLKNHLTEINSKLNTKNKMDLFMFAKKHNLD